MFPNTEPRVRPTNLPVVGTTGQDRALPPHSDSEGYCLHWRRTENMLSLGSLLPRGIREGVIQTWPVYSSQIHHSDSAEFCWE